MHVMNESRDIDGKMPTPEQLVGRQVRLLRQARGWSQQDVAEKMRAYGYQWSQATVTRLEAATRPIRLNELADLAALFGIPVPQFLEDPGFEVEDLEALELEITALTAKRDSLLEDLRKAHDMTMLAEAAESETAAKVAIATRRLEMLKLWRRPSSPKEAASEPAQP
jgi:transcriptional regulator with XRE-family HTH domain